MIFVSPRASARLLSALAASVLALAAFPAVAAVVAKVDGVEITDTDVKTAMDELAAGLPQQLEGKARDAYVLDYLIDVKLVAKQAEADKLADSPDFKHHLAFFRDKILMETMMGNVSCRSLTYEKMDKCLSKFFVFCVIGNLVKIIESIGKIADIGWVSFAGSIMMQKPKASGDCRIF